jgi:hypothetical protein
LPRLARLYEVRVRFQLILDTLADGKKRLRALLGLYVDILGDFPVLDASVRTFEACRSRR